MKNEAESLKFAELIAKSFKKINGFERGLIFYLIGDLGAGKSLFSRGFIQFFIPGQKVKSPTYTIVENYNFSTNTIYHLDLYRLCDPEELEYLAIRDLFSGNFTALVEWPQKGTPVLQAADVEIRFEYHEFDVPDETVIGRKLELVAVSSKGEALIDQISQH